MGADRDRTLGQTEEQWKHLQKLSDKYNAPGRYITIKAYEWTNYPRGHRNIYFSPEIKDPPLFCWTHKENDTPKKLNARLEGIDALIIAHSPAWRTGDIVYDWGPPTDKFRLVEIYSTHGASEYYDNPYPVHKGSKEIPSDSLLIKKILMYDIDQAPADSGNFVQDALAKGWKFGFIGSGDLHYLAYINQAYKAGIAAVFSQKLARNGIYRGLYNRETYATTGVRIGVRFSCNGFPMGSETSTTGAPRFKGEVIGTDKIKLIELVKFDGNEYSSVYRIESNKDIVQLDFTDRNFKDDSFYYLRTTQDDGNMAWASPIWIKHSAGPQQG